MLNAPFLSTDHGEKQTRENTKIMMKIVYVFHPRFSRSAPASRIFTLLVSNWCETHSTQLAKTDFKTYCHKFVDSCPLFHSLILRLSFPLQHSLSFSHSIQYTFLFLSLWYTFSHSTVNAFIECEEFQSNLHHTRRYYKILAHD